MGLGDPNFGILEHAQLLDSMFHNSGFLEHVVCWQPGRPDDFDQGGCQKYLNSRFHWRGSKVTELLCDRSTERGSSVAKPRGFLEDARLLD